MTPASGAADNGSHGSDDPVVSSAATPPAQADKEQTDAEPLSEFQEGQWWVRELDAMVKSGTDDQKRAVAVVHHMLRAALATTQAPAPAAPVLSDEQIITAWHVEGGWGGHHTYQFAVKFARAILAAGAMGEKT
jgi:hypothetical protein